MKKVMYIAINTDLNMSVGKIASQSAHAVKDYVHQRLNGKLFDISTGIIGEINELDEFVNKGNTIITVKANSKQMQKWKEDGFVVTEDYGYKEVEKGSLTSVCLGIYDKDDKIPKWIQRLRLLESANKLYLVLEKCYSDEKIIYTSLDKNKAEDFYKRVNDGIFYELVEIELDKDLR